MFIKHARSILEFGAPVWTIGLTKVESHEIEHVQKSLIHIALGENYGNYEDALKTTKSTIFDKFSVIFMTYFSIIQEF